MGLSLKYLLIIYLLVTCSPLLLQAQLHPSLVNREMKARKAALIKYGMSKSYPCIIKALNWFIENQNPDGSWGKTQQEAMTSLVILSFLTHSDVIDNKAYGASIKLAINWLSEQKINTRLYNGYPHAIKTFALAEALAITQDEKLIKVVTDHIEVILEGQQDNGMFNYKYSTNPNRQDLSFSSWNFQALKAAYISGYNTNQYKNNIRNALNWLTQSTTGEFQFPYSTQDGQFKTSKSKHTMRAAGTLSLQLFNKGNIKALQDDIQEIAKLDSYNINWQKPPKECLYGWYYATQAMFNAGGKNWKTWSTRIQREFILNQNQEGYWQYPGDHHGKFDEFTAKIYSTSLCTLILSTPFRYVPNSPLKPGKIITIKDENDTDIEEQKEQPHVIDRKAIVSHIEINELPTLAANKSNIIQVSGLVKDLNGKTFHNEATNSTFISLQILNSDELILINATDDKKYEKFRSYFKKTWFEVNELGPLASKERLCFSVSGIQIEQNGRKLFFPTSDINFFINKCKIGDKIPEKPGPNMKTVKVELDFIK